MIQPRESAMGRPRLGLSPEHLPTAAPFDTPLLMLRCARSSARDNHLDVVVTGRSLMQIRSTSHEQANLIGTPQQDDRRGVAICADWRRCARC